MSTDEMTDGVGDGGGSWSRTRLVDMWSAMPVNSADEMRPLAAENRLGLCNFSYGPLDTPTASSTGEVRQGWAVSSRDDCIWMLVVDPSYEAVVVNGYISPVVIILTLITNSLVCAVLLQRHMRTPTNVFLVALAISDALTGIVPLPAFIHFYTLGAYHSILVPPAWCRVYLPMSLHLPATWHTASIWLTVGLAFQRYVYICHNQAAKRLCTVRNAVIAVVVVYVAAILSQLFRNFENRYETISVDVPLGAVDVESPATERINITGCYFEQLLAQYNELYLSTYW